MTNSDDSRWMDMAIAEAKKGLGLTSPNPPVGAVVVSSSGVLLGKGFHQKAGAAHAEVEALTAVRREHGAEVLNGATVYVTLEPCSTTGKTPPCCEALITANVGRVVYAEVDPFSGHGGNADNILREKGIKVCAGVGSQAAKPLIAPFCKRIQTGLPWVIAKAGMSLDGRLTRPGTESQWLTNEAARADAHQLRAEVDAILIGAGTLRADDPSLTIRGAAFREEKIQPWRVVLTQGAEKNLPQDAKLFTDVHRERTRVYAARPLSEVLRDLADCGCNAVLIEGGSILLGSFFEAGLIDEGVFYYAPLWCGGATIAAGAMPLPASVSLTGTEVTALGDNVRVRARVERP